MVERERGIPAMVRECLCGHSGSLWLLAGHVHSNSTSVFALPQTKIVQVAHAKSVQGYWIYGLHNGQIVARVYRDGARGFRSEELPDLKQPAATIPIPFQNGDDVLWSLLIGDNEAATQASFVNGKGGNCGTWWFYVDELVFRLPLAEKGQGATRFGVLAALCKHRKTGEPSHVFASADGVAWDETPLLETKAALNLFAIPAAIRGSRALMVKVKSYGYNADTCVGGFALCR